MSHNITIEGGKTVRLPTSGKYCDRDIVITAEGCTEDLNAVLTEQESLIAELQNTLRDKASGGVAEPIIEPLEVTTNGTYTAPDGVDGYSPVSVSVPIPDGYIQPSGELEVTENGAHDVTAYASVNVNVASGGEGLLDHYANSNVTAIATHAYSGRNSFRSVEFPNVTSIGDSAFANCAELTSVNIPSATKIGRYSFLDCSKLTDADFPLVTSMSPYAFQRCSNLTSVDFPLLTTIEWLVFAECTNLTSVNIPSAKIINPNAFQLCTNLTSVDFPLVTSIGSSAFVNCTNLATVNFPSVTSIGGSAFSGCVELTAADFPLVTSIDGSLFRNDANLTDVNFPLATSIGGAAFIYCTNLTAVDFPLVTSIEEYGFYGCTSLTTLILRSKTMCTLAGIQTFTGGTPIAKGNGFIYVPGNLVEQYKSATNWSAYAIQIRAIEDYPEICGGEV